MNPVFLVALVPLLLGAVMFGANLAKHGGWAKSQQFRVLGELMRGVHGGRARATLFLSWLLLLIGSCTAFGAVMAGDADRARVCREHCAAEGYASGRIGPNTDRTDDRATWFVACICEGDGQEPTETRASDLVERARTR